MLSRTTTTRPTRPATGVLPANAAAARPGPSRPFKASQSPASAPWACSTSASTVLPSTFRLTHLDAFYFTLGTFTAAGTRNLSPISETARELQALQKGLDFMLIGFVVVLVMTRYSNLLDRPKSGRPEVTPPITPPADWSDAT